MSDRVFSGTLDVFGLQALVDACRQRARFAILERIDVIDFPPPQSEPIQVEQWAKGRLFDEQFELRWEQVGAAYRVILAGSDGFPALPEQLREQDIASAMDQVQEYYCWDERDKRLGRTLDYRCVPGRGDVKLTVREFRDGHSRLVFWRYVKMEREGGGQ